MSVLRTEADLLRTLEGGTYTLPDLYQLAQRAGLADRAGGRRVIQDGQEAARPAAGRCAVTAAGGEPERRWSQRWGLHLTPWTVSRSHPDPARRMQFYLGTGHPNHLGDSPVPVCVTAPTLARYRGRGDAWPLRAGVPWMGDSGAYAALILRASPYGHPWFDHPDEYGSMWVRLCDDIGPPRFVGIQDWPCEPQCLRRTGATVREHQQATLDNYLHLVEEFPMVPWLATLQGWQPWEYVQHFEMYARAGVDLAGQKVGIGSVCRRGGQADVARVLGTLAPLGMRMHAYGLSINALRLCAHLLDSSDSQAWSSTARRERIRLPGCTHTTRAGELSDCRNCFRYALAYREEVLDAVRGSASVREGEPPGLFELVGSGVPSAMLTS